MSCKITVAVAVYKTEKYLERCIDSILNQTFKDFELILIEDGSPDHCGEICDVYAAKDSRVRVIHQVNKGISAVRNRALDEAVGEYLAYVDSDDFLNEGYLEILYRVAVKTNADITMCRYLQFKSKEDLSIERYDAEKVSYSVIDNMTALKNLMTFSDNSYIDYVVAWNKLYRRSIFEGVRYPEGKIYEDEAVAHLLIYQCDKFAIAEAALYYYFYNPTGIMKSEFNLSQLQALDIYEGKIEFFKEKKGMEELFRSAVEMGYRIYDSKWKSAKISKNYPDAVREVEKKYIDYYYKYRKTYKPSYERYFDFYCMMHPRFKDYYRMRAYIEKYGFNRFLRRLAKKD